jgi:hypothetical protein
MHMLLDPDTLIGPADPGGFHRLDHKQKPGNEDRACQDGFDHSVPPIKF